MGACLQASDNMSGGLCIKQQIYKTAGKLDG